MGAPVFPKEMARTAVIRLVCWVAVGDHSGRDEGAAVMTAAAETCSCAGNVGRVEVLGVVRHDADADRRGGGRLPGDEVGQRLARDEVLGRKEIEPVALEDDVVAVALVGAGAGGNVVADLVDALLAALALGHGPGVDSDTALSAAGRAAAETVAIVVDRAADGAGADQESGRERDGTAVGGTSRRRRRLRPLEELIDAVVGEEGRRAVRAVVPGIGCRVRLALAVSKAAGVLQPGEEGVVSAARGGLR